MKTPSRVVIGLLALVITVNCGNDESSARKAAAAQRKQTQSQLKRRTTSAQAVPGPSESRRSAASDSGPPFERMAGYVVRGTDESSFRRCGSNRTHYIRVGGESAMNLIQRYRFRASVPLSPVYFVFNARVIDDTVVVGDHTYTSVLEVRSVFREQPGITPECAAPMRGSMIAGR